MSVNRSHQVAIKITKPNRQASLKTLKKRQTFKFSSLPWRGLRNLSLLTLILSTCAMGLLWLFHPHTLPVKHLILSGQHHTQEQAIRNQLQPFLQHNILNLDVPAMRQALQQLPWVADAQIRRGWQQTLFVTLEEYQALALWHPPDAEMPQATLTQRGDLLTFVGQQANLPVLVGAKAQLVYMQTLYQRLYALFSVAHLPLQELHCDARRACYAILTNGITLWLGRRIGDAPLRRFLQVYPQIVTIQPTPISDIDLRYPNGIAVRSRANEERHGDKR